jgi:tRNA threonylcarbamoyladenosine biosynthesis protein TsaE
VRAPADPSGAPDAAALDLVSHSSLHTERLGERLAAHAQPGDVVALWGELGAGKTVLARGVAIGLGIDEEAVTSPTFLILHEHFGGRLPLYHLDLYRLEQAQLGSTGWEEALDAGGVTLIEWPDRAGDLLPADRVDVRLEHVAETKRRVTVTPTGPRSLRLVDALRADAFKT